MAKTAKEIEDEKLKRKKVADAKKKKRYAYIKRKDEVYKNETGNYRYVYIFQTEDEKWSKIGWNSALIYKYYIANRIGRKAKLNNDTDFGLKSPEGIVSLQTDSLEDMLNKLRPLKMFKDDKKSSKEVLVIDIGYNLTEEELENCRHKDEVMRQRLNELLPVEVMMPELEAKIVSELNLTRRVVSKLSKFELEAWGLRLYKEGYLMLRKYREMAWGGKKPEIALKEIKGYVYEAMVDVSLAGRLDLMDLEMATRISAELLDIKHMVKAHLGEGDVMADAGVWDALASKKIKK